MDNLRLTPSEARILLAIQLRASAPLSLIAKDCEQREHVVRYTVNKLLNEGVIKKRPIINLSALGYTDYMIYLSISHRSQKSKEAFEKKLSESPFIGDVLELGGEYRYGFVYCCKDVIEVSQFVNSLAEQSDIQIFEQVVGIRTASVLYKRKYLSKKSLKGIDKITNGRSDKRATIDELDRKIIVALHEPHESYRELARRLNMSHSTFSVRLKELYKQKVILGEVYGVQAHKIGMSRYRLLILLRRNSEDLRKMVFKFCEESEAIVVCNEVLGSWSYDLLAEVENNHDMVNVVQSLYETLGDHVATIKSLPLFQFLKVSDFPLED